MIKFKEFLNRNFVPLSDAPAFTGKSMADIVWATREGRLSVFKDRGREFVSKEELARFKRAQLEPVYLTVEHRQDPLKAARNQDMQRLRQQGLTYREISQRFGITFQGVHAALHRK